MSYSFQKLLALTILIFLGLAHELPVIKKSNFDALVKSSKEVWILKIAHPQCGSCQEFNPIFHKLTHNNPNIKYGITYIDDNDGLDLANSLGSVMDNGLPGVVMFKNTDGSFVQLVSGSVEPENKLTNKIFYSNKKLKEIIEINLLLFLLYIKIQNNGH